MSNLKNSSHPLSHYTPCGSQTLSKMHTRFPQVYPQTLVKGLGGRVLSDNGQIYIDLISALGAVSVGYSDWTIIDALIKQAVQGPIFSLPNEIEYLAAQRLTELVPGTEMWKFGKNGTDGTVMAVRAARAFTNRTKILTLGYNGCADQFEVKGTRTAGIPPVLAETIDKALFNVPDTFECLWNREYACVLMEPMVYEYPKDGFLEEIRDICTKTGTLLIFDEVVNGGRFEGFTSSNYFKVVPDLYVLGKGISNGFPLCAVGGTRRVMQTFERNDFFASGTFGGECVSLASFLATTSRLQELLPQMISNGRRIQDSFNKLHWQDAECIGYPTRLFFKFKDPTKKHIFMQEMCLNGVLLGQANFIQGLHTDKDVTNIINAIFESYKSIKAGVTLIGPVPEEALKARIN